MVIWIIGLSAAGKSTLANAIVKKIREQNKKVCLLDGDLIRDLFKNDVDHTVDGRYRNAERLSTISKFLGEQGIPVVAAVLSIFPDWQDWNRMNITNYFQIYIKVSMKKLKIRETKGLYKAANAGTLSNVVGVDIEFPEPKNSDLVINNDIDNLDFNLIADEIFKNYLAKNL